MPTFLASAIAFSMVEMGARPEMTTASAVASAAMRASRLPVSRIFMSAMMNALGVTFRISEMTERPNFLMSGVPASMMRWSFSGSACKDLGDLAHVHKIACHLQVGRVPEALYLESHDRVGCTVFLVDEGLCVRELVHGTV